MPGRGRRRCSAIRSPTPVLSRAAPADPPLHVVMFGPGGDRHRPERVAGEDRPLPVGDARAQHGLNILAEALDRIVAAAGGLAVAVAPLVVGDHSQPALRQRPDHVHPGLERLGPAVDQHHGRAVLGPEHLHMQPGPVGGADLSRAAPGWRPRARRVRDRGRSAAYARPGSPRSPRARRRRRGPPAASDSGPGPDVGGMGASCWACGYPHRPLSVTAVFLEFRTRLRPRAADP